jgi:hypothetical protein
MERTERYKILSYTLFGLGLVILLAGLIPALFAANIAMALASAILITLCLIGAMLAGKTGFAKQPTLPADEHADRKVPLKPENMPMDEENWRRVHGSPPSERPQSRDNQPRRDE